MVTRTIDNICKLALVILAYLAFGILTQHLVFMQEYRTAVIFIDGEVMKIQQKRYEMDEFEFNLKYRPKDDEHVST